MDVKAIAKNYLIISLLTLLVLAPDLVFFIQNKVYNYAISGFFIVQALLLIPVVLFSRGLKIYYWILAILVSLTPIMLVPVFYMKIQVNAEMVGLVMDTNKREVLELMGWKMLIIIFAMIAFAWLFLKLSTRLPEKISWKQGLMLSLAGAFAFGVLPLIRTRKLQFYTLVARNTFRTYYPFRLGNAISLISSEMKNMERYKEVTKNFSYHASRKNITDSSRHIYLLIIGEASRYDHWSINGYSRNTSPRLQQLPNLYSFNDVASGGTMTILSVPQLITRADATTYDKHKQEKSILAAFKEAGYYTCWLSNQSQFGLTGNIGMHFNDGDTAIFCGHGQNEGNFTGNYDISVIDKMKEVIEKNSSEDIFMIVHLIGSHWRYVLRYPEQFAVFKPTSDPNSTLLTRPPKEQIINEYDNSILYTDFILDSISRLINKPNTKASFLYVSDHGENLNDKNDGTYFHSYKPNKVTAKVPLFIWMNEQYRNSYPFIGNNLNKHLNEKVSSAESVFYTMIDIGRLHIAGFDSSKSLTSPYFLPSRQPIRGDNDKIYFYNDLD
jgi:glucan phosphoethanolaminetransferase (alkaline phosphatase superfamily)